MGLDTAPMNSASAFTSYIHALNNPWDFSPQRSGVDCGIPTALVRAYLNVTGTIDNNLGFGTCWVAYPRLWTPIYRGEWDNSVTAAPWAYNNTSSEAGQDFPQTASAQRIFEKARISACSMRLTPIVNATSDQGSITFALIPPFSPDGITNVNPRLPFVQGGHSADDILCQLGGDWLQQHPLAQTVPFRHGATAYWRPQDPNSFTFQSAFLQQTEPSDAGDTSVTNTIAATQGVPFFAFYVSGATEGALFRLEMVLHLECTIASHYDGVVANGLAPHVIPAATALTAVRKVFGGVSEKSGHVGTSSGLVQSSGGGGTNVISKIASAVKTAASVGGDVVDAAEKFMHFGSSVLSTVGL